MTRKRRDKTSGSLAYNRLDFQVSQGILFSVELFDTCDYLIALDYYDDLAIIETPNGHSIISYYQVKTTENQLTLNSVLKQEWLADLYDHLSDEDGYDEIKDLGLITNCRIKNGSNAESATSYINKAPGQTRATSLDTYTASLIKNDIATKLGIDASEVDLSKLAIIRSTLDIHSHDDLAKLQFTSFVERKLGNVGIQVIQAAYDSLRAQFTDRQRTELPDNVEKKEIQTRKCISKETVNEALEAISQIDFPEIEKLLPLIPDDEQTDFCIAFSSAISDNLRMAKNLTTVQNRIESFIDELQIKKPFVSWKNACQVRDEYYKRYQVDFDLPDTINKYYILVMAFVLLRHM